MGLFRNKKEKVSPEYTCSGNVREIEVENMKSSCYFEVDDKGDCCSVTSKDKVCCTEEISGIYCIKVLGSGCKNCYTLFENTKEAVKNLGYSNEIEYVTDMEKIMVYGVMSMPALVVNEKVVTMGKVLKATDIENILYRIGF